MPRRRAPVTLGALAATPAPVGLAYDTAIATGWTYDASSGIWSAPYNPQPVGISFADAIAYGWSYDFGAAVWSAPMSGPDPAPAYVAPAPEPVYVAPAPETIASIYGHYADEYVAPAPALRIVEGPVRLQAWPDWEEIDGRTVPVGRTPEGERVVIGALAYPYIDDGAGGSWGNLPGGKKWLSPSGAGLDAGGSPPIDARIMQGPAEDKAGFLRDIAPILEMGATIAGWAAGSNLIGGFVSPTGFADMIQPEIFTDFGEVASDSWMLANEAERVVTERVLLERQIAASGPQYTPDSYWNPETGAFDPYTDTQWAHDAHLRDLTPQEITPNDIRDLIERYSPYAGEAGKNLTDRAFSETVADDSEGSMWFDDYGVSEVTDYSAWEQAPDYSQAAPVAEYDPWAGDWMAQPAESIPDPVAASDPWSGDWMAQPVETSAGPTGAPVTPSQGPWAVAASGASTGSRVLDSVIRGASGALTRMVAGQTLSSPTGARVITLPNGAQVIVDQYGRPIAGVGQTVANGRVFLPSGQSYALRPDGTVAPEGSNLILYGALAIGAVFAVSALSR